jgi:hypothetical protein
VGENGPVILPKWLLFTPFRDLLHATNLQHGANGFTSVVVYGCETWSLTLREEQRLRVVKNRKLRKIFGPKREEKN